MITIIFDIDGTLIDSMKFDSELYIQAVKKVLGEVNIHDDWGKYANVTDPGILHQIIEENKFSAANRKLVKIRRYFGELMKSRLESNPCKPIRGALQAIDEINTNPDFVVGFATGGWDHTAKMKLQSAGFSNNDIPLFSGDHHHERVSIMRLCKDHISSPEDDTVYVGDGFWDLDAARKLGWGFVGIGEHWKETAEIWISDYTDKNWLTAPIQALACPRFLHNDK